MGSSQLTAVSVAITPSSPAPTSVSTGHSSSSNRHEKLPDNVFIGSKFSPFTSTNTKIESNLFNQPRSMVLVASVWIVGTSCQPLCYTGRLIPGQAVPAGFILSLHCFSVRWKANHIRRLISAAGGLYGERTPRRVYNPCILTKINHLTLLSFAPLVQFSQHDKYSPNQEIWRNNRYREE